MSTREKLRLTEALLTLNTTENDKAKYQAVRRQLLKQRLQLTDKLKKSTRWSNGDN